MKELSRKDSTCDRAAQLVAYLYGEATPAQRREFESHLAASAACRDELAAFGEVRADVGLWREALLASAPQLSFDSSALAAAASQTEAAALSSVNGKRAPKRSALAAIREFFALSPVWLQAGGIAFAALALLLGVMTLANAEVRWDEHGFAFRTGTHRLAPQAETIEKDVSAPINEAETAQLREQLNNIKAERDALKNESETLRGDLDRARAQLAEQSNAVATLNASLQRANQRLDSARFVEARANSPKRNQINTQLAESEEEHDTHLVDLLGESR